jgi:Family of unknown function (DUF6352)
MREFWKSAGMHLLEPGPEGWLKVTPQFLLAYYTRPEIHPIDSSCAEENRLHEELLADPFRAVEEAQLRRIADQDAADNYRAVLAFRDLLLEAGTIEGAYLKLMRSGNTLVPPVVVDQMVHLIARNLLQEAADPIRLRAGEIFFREQSVSTEGGRILLADEEIVEMRAKAGRETGSGQLLGSGTAARTVELDVLDEDNKHTYWARSDRFDTVVDFRFGQPAPEAFARAVEGWLWHLLKIEVRVEPRPRIDDADWRWHIGLDREATRILNALYEGRPLEAGEGDRIVGLFRMRIPDGRAVIDRVQGKPIYLGLAMTADQRIKMKPQNLLTNLPLRGGV